MSTMEDMMILNIEYWVIIIFLQSDLKIISNFIYYFSYGKGQNKADTFQKTGRKQQLL